jgi:hypothetical protein
MILIFTSSITCDKKILVVMLYVNELIITSNVEEKIDGFKA